MLDFVTFFCSNGGFLTINLVNKCIIFFSYNRNVSYFLKLRERLPDPLCPQTHTHTHGSGNLSLSFKKWGSILFHEKRIHLLTKLDVRKALLLQLHKSLYKVHQFNWTWKFVSIINSVYNFVPIIGFF